ncbi:HNH endonuclease [Shewanella polaris]|uniref:HNH nuclease domain-containing protein n=1 Tax=Shewanella polaris TaxID=2588449 RepID=A0A4Y5YG12_9GAMM|nr:HNH endonuclease [Shewanella polaris]QDE31730.1 hypothetical protein FH971_12605 [Shewanella polaris]
MKAAVNCICNGKEIEVAEALELRDGSKENSYFTCVSCGEPVRVHKAGANSLAHFEHHERNYSCPYSEGKKIKEDTFSLDDPRAIEGYEIDRKILSGARNSSLARQRKQMDSYKCIACGFKLKLNGRFVIECHHKDPIGTEGVRETSLEDLISLCPTCHRISHTREKPLSLNEIVEARKSL